MLQTDISNLGIFECFLRVSNFPPSEAPCWQGKWFPDRDNSHVIMPRSSISQRMRVRGSRFYEAPCVSYRGLFVMWWQSHIDCSLWDSVGEVGLFVSCILPPRDFLLFFFFFLHTLFCVCVSLISAQFALWLSIGESHCKTAVFSPATGRLNKRQWPKDKRVSSCKEISSRLFASSKVSLFVQQFF